MTVQSLDSPSAAVSVGFASVLRERTQGVHREAERAGIIADLLRGRATRQAYGYFLASLLPAYEAMERHLARDDLAPALRAFAAPGLARGAALRHDIEALAEAAPTATPVLPEAQAYAAAVERAAQGSGIGLVAHAYARYLGDLSGGQILKPLLARTLGLVPDQLTFYDFPNVADIPACKTGLRQALDLIPVGSDDAGLVVDESLAAFRHTIAVLEAVSGTLAKA